MPMLKSLVGRSIYSKEEEEELGVYFSKEY